MNTGADACETRLMLLILSRLLELENKGHRCHFWRANSGRATTKSGRSIKFNENGCADIIGVAASHFVSIETKSKTGDVEPDQDKWAGAIQYAGGTYIVARCLEDALDPVRAILGITS